MHQLQRSWVRSQHPSAQWNQRGGRWSSVENSTKKKYFFLFFIDLMRAWCQKRRSRGCHRVANPPHQSLAPSSSSMMLNWRSWGRSLKRGEWFQHCLEFSWGRSLKPGEWFQHCLEFSWGGSLKPGEWLISTLSWVQWGRSHKRGEWLISTLSRV